MRRTRRLDGQWPRDVRHLDARLLWLQQLCAESVVHECLRPSKAWRVQRSRPGNKDCRLEANDLAFEKNTPSNANGMDGGGDSFRGCRGSKRLPCTNLEREEHVRDERLVLDLCENGPCDPNGVVGRTVCESHSSDD